MTTNPLFIAAETVPSAWAQALPRLMDRGVESVSPLVVTAPVEELETVERSAVQAAIDRQVAEFRAINAQQSDPKKKKYRHLWPVHTVANTLFPVSLWNPAAPDGADRLYARFEQAWPRIRKCKQNRKGLYFRRLTAARPKGKGDPPVNQLKVIVENYLAGNHRRGALQASVFDPAADHTMNRRPGFPCLQQVSFTPLPGDCLSVTGYYATQYLFDRAYGNYVGLCRLGHFIAGQIDMKLTRMTCVAARAELGSVGKTALTSLVEEVAATSVPGEGPS